MVQAITVKEHYAVRVSGGTVVIDGLVEDDPGVVALVQGAEDPDRAVRACLQIGARASHQSQIVAGRDLLDRRVEAVHADYEDRPIPRPAWWGGVRVTPLVFEFWQHRDNRLHDRLRYTADGRGWQVQRLQP